MKKNEKTNISWWISSDTHIGCCKHDHVISAAEWLRYFLSLSAAPGCSTSSLSNANGLLLLWTHLCREAPAALSMCERQRVRSVELGPDLTRTLPLTHARCSGSFSAQVISENLCRPRDGLATCPLYTLPLAQCQLGLDPAPPATLDNGWMDFQCFVLMVIFYTKVTSITCWVVF